MPGPEVSEWWCERGSLVALVAAPDAETAAERALARFRQRRRVQYDRSVSVRPAGRADVALWEMLRAQEDAGAEGARVGSADAGYVEVPLFA